MQTKEMQTINEGNSDKTMLVGLIAVILLLACGQVFLFTTAAYKWVAIPCHIIAGIAFAWLSRKTPAARSSQHERLLDEAPDEPIIDRPPQSATQESAAVAQANGRKLESPSSKASNVSAAPELGSDHRERLTPSLKRLLTKNDGVHQNKTLLRATAVLLSFIAAAYSCLWMYRYYRQGDYSHLAYISWLAALLLWLCAFLPWRAAPGLQLARKAKPRRAARAKRLAPMIPFLLVLGAGVFLRVYRFSEFPLGISNDEAVHGFTVKLLADDPCIRPFVPRGYGVETLHLYIAGLLLRWIPLPQLATRPVALTWSVASLILFAWFLHRQFGYQTALAGTAFMAFAAWHLVYSRVGLRMISSLPWIILTFHFLLRRSPHRTRDMLLAGLTMGVCLYTYSSLRLMPLLIGFYFVPAMMRNLRRGLLHGVALYGTALMTGLPMLSYAALMPGEWTARLQSITERNVYPHNAPEILVRSWDVLRQFYWFIPESYLGMSYADSVSCSIQLTTLTLGAIIPVFLTLGLCCAAARLRKPLYALLLLALLLGLIPSVIAGPNLTRQVHVMPLVFLFAALGAGTLWRNALTVVRPRLVMLAAALVLIATGIEGYWAYFEHYARDELARFHVGELPTAMGRCARTLTGSYFVVIFHSYGFDTIAFPLQDRLGQARLITIPMDDATTLLGPFAALLEEIKFVRMPTAVVLEQHPIDALMIPLMRSQFPHCRLEDHCSRLDPLNEFFSVAYLE